jgi:urea transporter
LNTNLLGWITIIYITIFLSCYQPQSVSTEVYTNNYLILFSHGFGQVIFQSNIYAGMLFIVGIFISRPIIAVYAIVSIVLTSIIAYLLKEPTNDIYLGLLSYNGVLCAITFAGKKTEDFIM